MKNSKFNLILIICKYGKGSNNDWRINHRITCVQRCANPVICATIYLSESFLRMCLQHQPSAPPLQPLKSIRSNSGCSMLGVCQNISKWRVAKSDCVSRSTDILERTQWIIVNCGFTEIIPDYEFQFYVLYVYFQLFIWLPVFISIFIFSVSSSLLLSIHH